MAPIEYPPLKPGNFLRALEAKVPQKFVRDILNRLRFRDQAPLSDAALFVPLQDVHAAYAPDPGKGAPEFRRRHSGLVRGGDWDLSIKPLEDSFKHIACRLHFLEGKPWEDTGVYERHLQNIAKRGESDGCRTLEDLKRRYAGVDRLYEEVSRSGRKCRDISAASTAASSSISTAMAVPCAAAAANTATPSPASSTCRKSRCSPA